MLNNKNVIIDSCLKAIYGDRKQNQHNVSNVVNKQIYLLHIGYTGEFPK